MIAYRGTKNLTPLKLEEFYKTDGQHGEGMYFSSSMSVASHFSKPQEGFGILATYEIKDSDVSCFKHDSPINEEMESIERKVLVKLEELFNTPLEDLENEGFFLDSDIPLDLKSFNQTPSPLSEEIRSLHSLYLKLQESLNHLASNYAMEITSDGYAVILREDFVSFELISFSINFLNEEQASVFFKEFNDGDLEGTWVRNIDKEMASLAHKIIFKD